jgi:exocyst complex protein 7
MITLFQMNQSEFSVDLVINTLVNKIEQKSHHLEKKYPPLKYIFMVNNIYFILSKIKQPKLAKFIDKNLPNSLNDRIKSYIKGYLEVTWKKVYEDSFSDKDKNLIVFENDNKTLKNASRQLVKKKFSNFNDEMKLNLKFQRQIRIIDNAIEKQIVQANIEYVVPKYQEFFEKYSKLSFTEFQNKYILYQNSNDVVSDLKLYFIDSFVSNK